ncbi:hypothetical protein AURDEDRAFT_173179 [Auricularia subglabra TFB-10046 SS5]|nr:hypothetical protein AURDEDRAFT_173179 [Auricularia subglabra TFB-10046 SS5]
MTVAVKTGTAASQLLKADVPPLEDPLLHFMGQPMDVLRQAALRTAPSVKTLKQKRGMKVVMHPIPLLERQRTRQAIL